MEFTASALAIAITLGAGGVGSVASGADVVAPVAAASTDPTAVAQTPVSGGTLDVGGLPNIPKWLVDHSASRPKALPVMYATLGALQALDVYSTRAAIDAGGRELNPVVRKAAGNSGALLAIKALSSAGSIYFAERAWKKNRKDAVILMAAINGVTAAVVANNLKNAR